MRRLGRINFRCAESLGRQRAEQVIEIIEADYERAQKRRDKRLLIEVTQTSVRLITQARVLCDRSGPDPLQAPGGWCR
ncbi:MAG: hypothetical protein AUH30_20095 [Candidatus Rokubacteria bacterium 13_1_40CM_68_15]|nr:MAG: hypothetical protein AUH30_20095 [Candidatus Rokubacteria bacterium 13_1_40CM_68_15]